MLGDPAVAEVALQPASYHHRWRALFPSMTAEQRSAANSLLVEHHQLVLPADKAPCSRSAGKLVGLWPHIHTAAMLIGAAKHPHSAMAHRDYLRASPWIRGFMQMGFSRAVVRSPQPMGSEDLRAWGGAYLTTGLASDLPHWLVQRLPLIFPPNATPGVESEPFDYDCLWSALHHAKSIARHSTR